MTRLRPSSAVAFFSAIACAIVVLTTSAAAQSGAVIGHIKVASGTAHIVRGTTTVPAKPGVPLYESDSLKTGADGKLGATLNDDTRVSLGPDSEARLSSFRYAPADGALAFVFNLIRGAAVYASGQIAKLSPDAVRLETPSAIVGVRGTTLGLVTAE